VAVADPTSQLPLGTCGSVRAALGCGITGSPVAAAALVRSLSPIARPSEAPPHAPSPSLVGALRAIGE
jgi:hypothetical protein